MLTKISNLSTIYKLCCIH